MLAAIECHVGDIMNNSSELNVRSLFIVGNLAIFMIGLGFAVRANIASDLQGDIFNALDLAASASMVGEVIGATFIGFATTLLIGSALVDWVGIKAMLLLSAVGYIAGSVCVVMASVMEPSWASYWLIYGGLLLTGLGWGAVEAASNPLIAALFPEEKTARLNALHAWWPAGIVVGGLMGFAMGAYDWPWQINLAILVVPAIVLFFMVLRQTFPVTERVAAGISYADMFKELGRSPAFFIWMACMLITAASELAPGQWVDITLSNVVGMQGILLLVYVSALMFVMRFYAGFFTRFLSPVGVMFVGSALAALGLYTLSLSTNPAMAFGAATIWGIGVCYMWPTMLAITSERFPRGGALFMGMMGFAGGMSIQFVLPELGKIFDEAKIEAAGSLEALQGMAGAELAEVMRYASVESFQSVAFLPLLLLPVFGFIWLRDRSKGGYQAQKIGAAE